jgi:hypothetical protein
MLVGGCRVYQKEVSCAELKWLDNKLTCNSLASSILASEETSRTTLPSCYIFVPNPKDHLRPDHPQSNRLIRL